MNSFSKESATIAVLAYASYGSSHAYYLKKGLEPAVLLEVPGQVRYFDKLGGSRKAIIVGSQTLGSTQSNRLDSYNCSDFTGQAAAQAFFLSASDDPNRLDADGDGRACEAFDSLTYTNDIENTSSNYTPSSSPSRCYVSSYTRKDGTRVSGYYRKC